MAVLKGADDSVSISSGRSVPHGRHAARAASVSRLVGADHGLLADPRLREAARSRGAGPRTHSLRDAQQRLPPRVSPGAQTFPRDPEPDFHGTLRFTCVFSFKKERRKSRRDTPANYAHARAKVTGSGRLQPQPRHSREGQAGPWEALCLGFPICRVDGWGRTLRLASPGVPPSPRSQFEASTQKHVLPEFPFLSQNHKT